MEASSACSTHVTAWMLYCCMHEATRAMTWQVAFAGVKATMDRGSGAIQLPGPLAGSSATPADSRVHHGAFPQRTMSILTAAVGLNVQSPEVPAMVARATHRAIQQYTYVHVASPEKGSARERREHCRRALSTRVGAVFPGMGRVAAVPDMGRLFPQGDAFPSGGGSLPAHSVHIADVSALLTEAAAQSESVRALVSTTAHWLHHTDGGVCFALVLDPYYVAHAVRTRGCPYEPREARNAAHDSSSAPLSSPPLSPVSARACMSKPGSEPGSKPRGGAAVGAAANVGCAPGEGTLAAGAGVSGQGGTQEVAHSGGGGPGPTGVRCSLLPPVTPLHAGTDLVLSTADALGLTVSRTASGPWGMAVHTQAAPHTPGGGEECIAPMPTAGSGPACGPPPAPPPPPHVHLVMPSALETVLHATGLTLQLNMNARDVVDQACRDSLTARAMWHSMVGTMCREGAPGDTHDPNEKLHGQQAKAAAWEALGAHRVLMWGADVADNDARGAAAGAPSPASTSMHDFLTRRGVGVACAPSAQAHDP